MGLGAYLRTSYGQMMLLSIGFFAILSILIVPSYFLAIRPKRGTTEWMRRIDRPEFSALIPQRLRWSDIAWLLLSAFCTLMLRLAAYLLKYLRRGLLTAISQYFETIVLYYLLPCAILTGLTYLLLRGIFDQPLPAICGAILAGTMQIENYLAAILLVLSLIFLWRFIAADENLSLIWHSAWLFLSLLFYGVALLRFWSMIWLSPIYLGAYIFAQAYRWRKTKIEHRGMALAISLLLLFFMAVGALLCAWAYYCYRYNQMEQLLNLQRFWEIMSFRLVRRIGAMIYLVNPLHSIFAEDVILLLIGGFCYLPILYSALAQRDSVCLVLLALVPCFLLMWMLSGMYLLVPVLVLALTWVCNAFTEREYPALTISFTVLTVFGFLVEYYI